MYAAGGDGVRVAYTDGGLRAVFGKISLALVSTTVVVVMAALWNRVDHYIFPVISSSIFFLFSFFFSSPNLSGRRMDVCHTSTHGVALVRI